MNLEIKALFGQKQEQQNPTQNIQTLRSGETSSPNLELKFQSTNIASQYELIEPELNDKKIDNYILAGLTGTSILFLGFTEPPAKYIGGVAFVSTFAYPVIRDAQEKRRFRELDNYKLLSDGS